MTTELSQFPVHVTIRCRSGRRYEARLFMNDVELVQLEKVIAETLSGAAVGSGSGFFFSLDTPGQKTFVRRDEIESISVTT